MKHQKILLALIFSFFCLYEGETALSAERNIEKCTEFSSIGLHVPAIEQCQKAISDGVSEETELVLLYFLANSNSSIGNNEIAKDLMSRILKANTPARDVDYYLAGLIETKLNNHKEAVLFFEKAILNGLDTGEIKRQYARALFKSGEIRKSNLILTGMFYENSSDAQSMTQLSENLIANGNYAKANHITDRILNINPSYSYAYYLKYIIALKEGNSVNALMNINKAIMRDRRNTKYLIEKVKLLSRDKKYDLAKYNLTIIEELNPKTTITSEILEYILDLQASDLHLNAREMIKYKNYEDAIKYYNKAIKYNPSGAILYFERGQLLSILEEYIGAEKDLKIASSLNDRLIYKNINLMLGKIYYNLDERSKSITHIDKELAINPENKEALLWQIRSYSEVGQYELAEDYARRLLIIDPESPDGYSVLGDIKLMQGDTQKSNELHNKVIELDPNYNIATRKKLK